MRLEIGKRPCGSGGHFRRTASGGIIITLGDAGPSATSKEAGVEIVWGERIPLRDGVNLNATIYRPQETTDPLPAVLTLTPYIADTYHERGIYFAKHGYVFALVDVRGRGSSEGTFEPMVNEARDGHDVVEWLARQPFCSGKVAMWGGSYAGFDQWATAKEFPPHLATIVPAASAFPAVDFPFVRNIFYLYDIRWATLTSGRTPNDNLFDDDAFWIDRFREHYHCHLPFRELDKVAGNPATCFQKWLDHPMPDAYWDAMVPGDDQFRKIDIPILTITGHYDADQSGAMEFYRRHQRFASPEAVARHYLVIGPWDHPGTRTPKREFDGLTFGEASVVDLNALHREWYDWTMKDGPMPSFLKGRVAYYVAGAGAEFWKYAPSLEALPCATRTLYLDSLDGHANDAFLSGRLTPERPGQAHPDRYTYDPLDVRPADLEREKIKEQYTDQRYALNLFGNGLVYHSDSFPEETEITGCARLVVWIALDVLDTDFLATLSEILPDGKSVELANDLMRARYRHSQREEEFVAPGTVERYEFNGFNFFSRRLAKGSRLRLLFRCPNSIYWQKNYNAGGVVADESAIAARTAHITLYHDANHPSAVEVPVAAQTG